MIIPFDLSSNLAHTWFVDLDGTILKHNGHKNPPEELLPGVHDLWNEIPPDDCIILVSARDIQYKDSTLEFINLCGLRYNHAIFNVPMGERIVVNDTKPNGLGTALAWNVLRDSGFATENSAWIKEWNSPAYQAYKKDNFEKLIKYLQTPPSNILDIGCGLAFEAREFNRVYGTDIWLLDGEPLDNQERSTLVNDVGYHPDSTTFMFYHKFDWLKKELLSRGATNYQLVDVNNINIPADKKFDVIWSFLSCGFHYPASTYRELIEKHSHANTKIIVDLRMALKTKELYKEDCYDIVGEVSRGRKHVTVEIKFK